MAKKKEKKKTTIAVSMESKRLLDQAVETTGIRAFRITDEALTEWSEKHLTKEIAHATTIGA
jgi:hypothetical protein